MAVDVHVLNSDIAAKHRMNLPHRRVADRDAVDQHVLTAIRLDELRPQIVSIAKDTLANRHAFLRHREQRVAVGTLLRHSFFPTVLRTAVPGPPVFGVALSVEYAFARDRDVALLERIDEWRVVENLDAFPAREDDGQKVFRVRAELDRRAIGDFEVDVALQMYRARQISAVGNDDSAAARSRAFI